MGFKARFQIGRETSVKLFVFLRKEYVDVIHLYFILMGEPSLARLFTKLSLVNVYEKIRTFFKK